jgi:hypothetical protein
VNEVVLMHRRLNDRKDGKTATGLAFYIIKAKKGLTAVN